MNAKYSNRDLVLGSLLLTVGLILPMIFHSFGIAGQIFLPMHIPILLGGLVLPPSIALFVGVATPILSSLLTGMPVFFPMAIIMVGELGTYGLVGAVLNKKFNFPIISTLIVSMIMGRIAAGLTVSILVGLFNLDMNPLLYVKGAVITGIPGLIVQLLIIPVLAHAIKVFYKVAT